MKISNAFLLGLLCSMLLFSSCKKDENEMTEYRVDIEILSPTASTSMPTDDLFTVHVKFSRPDDLIHNVNVEILDDSNTVVQELLKQHAHQMDSFELKLDDVSISSPGTYSLKAYSTDMTANGEHHGGESHPEEHNIKSVNFTVQ